MTNQPDIFASLQGFTERVLTRRKKRRMTQKMKQQGETLAPRLD